MSRSEALRRTFARPMLKRSIGVAVVVGTGLNVINQGDAIFHGEPLVLWKLALTYAVPFAVSSYGSYGALRGPDRGPLQP
ncbi:MAG: nitrate/nitrite transporter NrtS [Sphingomonas sp.]|nr:nitrate/nitrite transporter NrtS [Sphingomonas sp.]